MTTRRRLLTAAATAISVLAIAIMWNWIRAGATVLEALGVSVPRPFSPDPEPEATTVGEVSGRLYSIEDARAVLIVPGATPAGVADARVNAVARALARSGRTVFIPELELYQERLSEEDLERIVGAVLGLAERTDRPVTVFGSSYGGSLAMVAAADHRLEGRISRLATLGAYYDLVGVIQAVTTGVSIVGGNAIPWERPPVDEDFLAVRAVQLLAVADRDPLLAAVEGRLDPGELSSEARSLYNLLVNEDPRLTEALVDVLPASLQAMIGRFSPARVADRIGVPLLALHSTDDPAVPYAELLRLEREMPQASTLSVSLLRHVDFDPGSVADWVDALPDLLRLRSLAAWMLAG